MKKDQLMYVITLFWVLLGFLLRLDYPKYPYAYGIDLIKFFNYKNLFDIPVIYGKISIFMIFSFSLITYSYLMPNRLLPQLVLVVELIFWLILFLFFKQGYEIGFGGSYDEQVALYDLIAIFLRLLLISQFYNINRSTKIILVLLSSISIITLKINL